MKAIAVALVVAALAMPVEARFVSLVVDPRQPITYELALQNCSPGHCGVLTILTVKGGRLDVEDVPPLTPGDSGNAEQIRGTLTISPKVERIFFKVNVEQPATGFLTVSQDGTVLINHATVVVDEDFVLNTAR